MIHVDEKSLQSPLVVAQICITSSVINICKFEVKELIKGNLGAGFQLEVTSREYSVP